MLSYCLIYLFINYFAYAYKIRHVILATEHRISKHTTEGKIVLPYCFPKGEFLEDGILLINVLKMVILRVQIGGDVYKSMGVY